MRASRRVQPAHVAQRRGSNRPPRTPCLPLLIVLGREIFRQQDLARSFPLLPFLRNPKKPKSERPSPAASRAAGRSAAGLNRAVRRAVVPCGDGSPAGAPAVGPCLCARRRRLLYCHALVPLALPCGPLRPSFRRGGFPCSSKR